MKLTINGITGRYSNKQIEKLLRAHLSWVQWFDDGSAHTYGKDTVGLARPFRRVPIQ